MTDQAPSGWFLKVRAMPKDQAIPYLKKLLNIDLTEARRTYQETMSLPYDEVIETQDPQGTEGTTWKEMEPDEAYYDQETGFIQYRKPGTKKD